MNNISIKNNTQMEASSNKFFFDLTNNIDMGIMVIDENHQTTYSNKWVYEHCPVLDSQLTNQFFDIFPELTQSRLRQAIDSALFQNLPSVISYLFNPSIFPFYNIERQLKGGLKVSKERIDQQINVRPISIANSQKKHCIISITDISALVKREQFLNEIINKKKLAEEALKQEQQLFVTGPTIVFKLIANKSFSINYVSANILKQLGYTPEHLQNKSFLKLIFSDDKKTFKKIIKQTIKKEKAHFELIFKIHDKSGQIRWVNLSATMIKSSDEKVSFYHCYLIDISAQKKIEQEISQQAYYDILTKLPNRRLLSERLNQEIARAKRRNFYSALVYLDLDKFKYINDSLGHNIGDELLKDVSTRIQTGIRTEDMAARIGGDEFVILLSELNTHLITAGERAAMIVEKLRKKLSQHYSVNGHDLHTTPSIGIVIFPRGKDTEELIIQNADTAMYRAKESGRNTICFYTKQMQDAANMRISMEKDLRQSIKNNELMLLFQPQISRKGKVISCESLIRWTQNGAIISPADFIPLAEETGFILKIGRWVLDRSCYFFKHWQQHPSLSQKQCIQHIAVNISPKEFREV